MWKCRFCFYQFRHDDITITWDARCPKCGKTFALVSFDPKNDEPEIPSSIFEKLMDLLDDYACFDNVSEFDNKILERKIKEILKNDKQ